MSKMNQQTWYRICQLAGWSLYFLFGLGMMILYMPEFYFGIVVNQAVITLVLFGLSHYHRHWIRRKQILDQPALKIIGTLLITTLLLSVLAQFIITPTLVFIVGQPDHNYHWTHSLGYLFNTYMVLIVWTVLYVSIKAVIRQRKSEIDRWRLEAELKNAELHRLRDQINPHFIFNALNNIRSLVTENPDQARDAITRLSNLLRSALKFQSRHLIPADLELEIVRDYLELEKIQLEDRLQVRWNLEISPDQIKLPAMSLQMLVENAIKHGISNRQDGGVLQIEMFREQGDVVIRVTNPGTPGESNPDSTGLGLINIRQRLVNLMGDQASLTLRADDDLVVAEMRWPENSAGLNTEFIENDTYGPGFSNVVSAAKTAESLESLESADTTETGDSETNSRANAGPVPVLDNKTRKS